MSTTYLPILLLTLHQARAQNNNFCGMSWADASENCDEKQPCPSGSDDECLLPGLICFADTMCSSEGSSASADPLAVIVEADHEALTNRKFCGSWWAGAQESCSLDTYCGHNPTSCGEGMECHDTACHVQDLAKAEYGEDWKEILMSSLSSEESSPQSVKLDYDDPKRKNFCGKSWFDANDNCAIWCLGEDSDCPPGQGCWGDTTCFYDDDLQPTTSPTTGPPTTEAPVVMSDPINNQFCGEDWNKALDNCSPDTHCLSDDDCPGGHLCIGFLPGCNLVELQIAAKAKEEADMDEYNTTSTEEMQLTPEALENFSFCGKDRIDAVDNCSLRTHCPDNECPEGTTCFHNIKENYCDSYYLWIGSDTPFPSASPVVLTESPRAHVTEKLNVTSTVDESGEPNATLAIEEFNTTSAVDERDEPNTTLEMDVAGESNTTSTESPSGVEIKEPANTSSMIAPSVTPVPSVGGTTPWPTSVLPTMTQISSTPTQTLEAVPIKFGICAHDSYELHQTYRSATECSSEQPCPDDLTCFEVIDLATSAERPTSKPSRVRRSNAPSEQPSQSALSSSPTVATSDAPNTSSPSVNPTPALAVSQVETSSPTALKFYCAVNKEELKLSCGTAVECTDGSPCPEGLGCIHYQCDQHEEEEPTPAISSEPKLFCASSMDKLETSCATAQSCNSGPCPSGTFCFPFDCNVALVEEPASELTLNDAESESPVSDTTLSTNDLGSGFCPPGYTGYHSQGDHNCKIYYECKDGEVLGEAHTCGDDLKYDIIRQMCWYQDEVDDGCRGPPMTSTPTQYFTAKPTYHFDKSNREYCPKDYVGSLSHKNFDCKIYYQCKYGEIIGDAQTCKDDLKWDIVRQMCWYGDEVNDFCYGPPMNADVPAPTPYPSFQPEIHSTTSDESMAMFSEGGIYTCTKSYTGWTLLGECTQYYWCEEGTFVGDLLECEDELLFDVNDEVCKNSTEVQCRSAAAERSEYSWPESDGSQTEEAEFPGTEQWKVAYFSHGVSWKSTKAAFALSSIPFVVNLLS